MFEEVDLIFRSHEKKTHRDVLTDYTPPSLPGIYSCSLVFFEISSNGQHTTAL